LVGAVSAGAAPGDPFQYESSFALPDAVQSPSQMAVNHQTGNVLVASQGRVAQFDPSGNPLDFSATGSSIIEIGSDGQFLIDNSGGPNQGNFYVVGPLPTFGAEQFYSYDANGNPIGENPHQTGNYGIFSMSVAPGGQLWVFGFDYGPFAPAVLPVTPTGQPLAPSEPWPVTGGNRPVSFDDLGNLYMPGDSSSTYRKFDGNNHFESLGDTGLPIGEELQIDPSTNDLYMRSGSTIYGVHYSDPLVKSTPYKLLTGPVSYGAGAFAFDSSGQKVYVAEGKRISIFRRAPNSAPFGVGAPGVRGIRSDVALVRGGQLSAGGSASSYHFEYGTTTAYGSVTPEVQIPFSLFPVEIGETTIEGLRPDTTYHVRMVVTNAIGTTYGPDRMFKTYPTQVGGTDPCPNALARKQTTAQRLPDCRAYELASASDTGGYDVESYLAPGQHPFGGFPLATDKLLYSTHSGAVPGPWNATNNGPDPYVATRTASGWVTTYKGLPSDLSVGTFSSVLGEADSSLSTLAFAGPNLCSPCFGSGLETGIPVRLPSGSLVQGMSGSLAGSVPVTAKPEGKVAKYFPEDDRKLLFASKYAFEPGANDDNGSLTVYARNLSAGTTEIVSTDPSGNALTGEGISELDVSSDGSRVVIGRKVGFDPLGNELVHPYLHIAGRPGTIDLAPTSTTGVLYAGMTSDGSKVFFASVDKLDGTDTDNSADLYEADIDPSGSLDLRAITTANDSDSCAPVNCSVVPISGGGGVAPTTGAIYFLSPESFGGQGTPNLPNLYLASPSGSISFVATLELDNPLLLDSLTANAIRRTGDFQTTPSGNYAAFGSKLPLTGVDYFGFRNVFRYAAIGDQLTCPSCDTSGTTDASFANNVELAPNGLSLLEDGRVFFTSVAQLVLLDTNGHKDVYEWINGSQKLISSGAGPFDSALLSASPDGTDVFFFTHDRLAPEEDRSGNLMKIYDAREGGGFFKLPASVPCQASDECHGPGTPQPGPADIKSSGKTTQGNAIFCAKKLVKKRGKCVKKKQAHAKKKTHHKKRKSGGKKRAAAANGKRGGRDA
jgi:hypothetical protein